MYPDDLPQPRHPSRWLLDPEESPRDCWGLWSSECVVSPSCISASPSSGAGETSQQLGHQLRIKHYPSSAGSVQPAVGPEIEPDVGLEVETNIAKDNSIEGLKRHEEAAQHQEEPHRQWWQTVGPTHPCFEGVPSEWFQQDVLKCVLHSAHVYHFTA